MLKSKLIDDIILRVTKGKPSDDLELEREQVAHLVDIEGDKLLREFLNEFAGNRLKPPDFYYKREVCKKPIKEEIDCVDDCGSRITFELSQEPINLLGSLEVGRVQTNKGIEVLKTTPGNIGWIKDLPFAKPTKDNLVYYREGRRLIIEGYSPKNILLSEFLVWYIPGFAGSQENDSINISDDLVSDLTIKVEEIVRRQMSLVDDLENDGVQ